MNDSWHLVVPALLIGLVFGTVWIFWWRGRSRSTSSAATSDRELQLRDLEARQTALYRQLRTAEDGDREELELAAARNLKAIEEAGGGRRIRGESEGERLTRPDPAPAARRASAWLGFLGGVACAGLIGVLVFWAQRDAQPRPDSEPNRAMATGERHPDGVELDARQAAALEQLAQRVENEPADLMARKQYAVGLLSNGQFLPAFEQAEILLASDSADPDGLYVKAMVRMRMGQIDEAGTLFEQLIGDYPDHIPALTALGVLQLRTAGLPAAEALWARAMAASGGSNPEIERLIAAARAQVAGSTGAPEATTAQRGTDSQTTGAENGSAYTLDLELAAGRSVAPGSVLFLSLRKGDVGPPAAVKRISSPIFPLTLTLSAADSMLGRPLPSEGTISARLDADGSASTRGENDPSAQIDLEVGQRARLVLQ